MENEYIDLPSGNLPYATKQEVRFMDLLNEYLAKYYAEHGNKNLYIELEGWSIFNVHETVVISRRFGFIKWLVDNDKIKPLGKFIGWETDEDEPYIQFDLVDQYIAYLSIQDNPIEFLISILK